MNSHVDLFFVPNINIIRSEEWLSNVPPVGVGLVFIFQNVPRNGAMSHYSAGGLL